MKIETVKILDAIAKNIEQEYIKSDDPLTMEWFTSAMIRIISDMMFNEEQEQIIDELGKVMRKFKSLRIKYMKLSDENLELERE